MPKDWKELSDDDILNFDGPQTAEIARLERIMRHREAVALKELRGELRQLADRVGTSTDRFVGVGNRLIETIEADSRSQARQQRAMIGLTVVIALATVVYVVATWFSVEAMQEGNDLQRQELRQNQGRNTQSNQAIQPTLVPRAADG